VKSRAVLFLYPPRRGIFDKYTSLFTQKEIAIMITTNRVIDNGNWKGYKNRYIGQAVFTVFALLL
jgi:hypothetical protein